MTELDTTSREGATPEMAPTRHVDGSAGSASSDET